MQLLEQYISELTSDVMIDEFNMKEVQMKLPAIKHKWVGRLMRTKVDIDSKYIEKAKLVQSLAEKLIEQSPVTMALPLAKKKVEDHTAIKALSAEIKELRLVVEFLEKTEKILGGISFDIKNLVEIIKLETL